MKEIKKENGVIIKADNKFLTFYKVGKRAQLTAVYEINKTHFGPGAEKAIKEEDRREATRLASKALGIEYTPSRQEEFSF